MILSIGNYLNTDNAKGNAIGINLNVLSMLEIVKSNVEEKYTLLEVLVLNIRTKEQNLLNFYKDFNDFEQVLMVYYFLLNFYFFRYFFYCEIFYKFSFQYYSKNFV